MRIKIIDELLTPGFRKLVDQRLHALQARFAAANDLRKLETVLLVGPLLKIKEVPWGICGLILTIYERTMNQAMMGRETDAQFLDAMTEALKSEYGEDETPDIDEIMSSPEKFEKVGERLLAENPGFREAAEKQLDEMTGAFESELMKGKVHLNLFSDDELSMPFERMEKEFGVPFEQIEESKKIERLFDTVAQVIQELMTPERYQRLRKNIETTANAWMREHKKWGSALRIELELMDETAYEDNKFIWAAFFNQVFNASRQIVHSRQPKKPKH